MRIPRKYLFLAWFAVGLLAIGASGCGSKGGNSDVTAPDGSNPDGNNPDDGPTCVAIGELCEATIECCGERSCEADGTGMKRCTETSYCKAAGATCTQASECCSLSCDGTCQADGGLCSPAGTSCSSPQECCSNICDGTTCQPLGTGCASAGERCSTEGVDASCCSMTCVNFGSDGSPDLRCGRASSCGARGEICVNGSDCCSGTCDNGRCPTQNQIGGQRFAGEPCVEDSDCASYACAAAYQGGPKVCQFLGGCRPAGEICSESWQCCSNIQLLDGGPGQMCSLQMQGTGCVPHTGVPGLAICDLQEGPKEVGEICKDTEGNRVHDCCPADACELTITGVSRCAGPGGFDECLPNGDSCLAADQCCSRICAPVQTDTGTVLQCGDCVADDGTCTTSADCCNQSCVDGVCQGAANCVALGGSCQAGADCCSGYCSGGTCTTVIVL